MFPVSYPPLVTVQTTLGVVAAVLVGTVVVLVRQTGAGALNTLYAEDGKIFLGQAVRRGWTGSLAMPYAGYFHAVPRLMADVASALPVRAAAPVLSVMAAATVAALAVLVYRATNAHLASQAIRWLLAAAVVLLPAAQEEAFNNIANLHWFLLFAAAWVLLWNPLTRWEVAVGSLVVVLAALSDPLALVLVPLAVLRLWSVRSRQGRVQALALVAGIVTQLAWMAISGAQRAGLSPSANVVRAGTQYVRRVVGQTAFGARLILDTGTSVSISLTIMAVLLVASAVLLARARWRSRFPVASLLFLLSLSFYAASLLSTGLSPPRYSVVPILLLLSALAYLLDGLQLAQRSRPVRAMAWLGLVVVVAGWAYNFRYPNRRSVGPKWSVELARAKERCSDIDLRQATVPIAPRGWRVVLPCDVVRPKSH